MLTCVAEGVSKWMFTVKEPSTSSCDYITIIGGGAASTDTGNTEHIVGGTATVRWK